MSRLPFLISKLHHTLTNKKLITAICILTALLLVSGFPGYIALLSSRGEVHVSTPEKETLDTTRRHIAFSPVAALLYAVGFIGLMGMANIHNPNYKRFVPLCYAFICVSYGCIILLEKFTLGF
jgi:hypothetical protein